MSSSRRTFLKLMATGAAAGTLAPVTMGLEATESAKAVAARPRVEPLKRSIVRANGVDLFVRDTASDRPAMLCLHGMEGRGETFTGLIAHYRDRYRVIAPDMRGHGYSGRPIARYAFEDLAEDMHELLRQLGATPAVVLAHSMGANVACFLAARQPEAVKALLLLDPPSGEGPERPADIPPESIPDKDPLLEGWPLPYPSREEALRDVAARLPYPEYQRFFGDSLVESVAGYEFMFSGRAMAALSAYWQGTLHLLPQIRCPSLFLRATETHLLSREQAQAMASLIPNCTYVEIEDAGHMVHLQKPEEFYAAFDAWLARVGAGRVQARPDPDRPLPPAISGNVASVG
jgi:2-succinyl-6-hydroxy-2,4-cyclohexadiene-1-carboxylate synthase